MAAVFTVRQQRTPTGLQAQVMGTLGSVADRRVLDRLGASAARSSWRSGRDRRSVVAAAVDDPGGGATGAVVRAATPVPASLSALGVAWPRRRGIRRVSGRSSIGRFARSRRPARQHERRAASASRFCPSGRSNSRTRISRPHQAPAAAIAVPSPNGRWNATPSARRFSRKRTRARSRSRRPRRTRTGRRSRRSAAVQPTRPRAARDRAAATRRAGRGHSSESLATREPCIGVVPVGDLVLALLPAEVDLAPVADAPGSRRGRARGRGRGPPPRRARWPRPKLEEPSETTFPALRRRCRACLPERLARVLVGEAVAAGAQALDALDHPRERRVRPGRSCSGGRASRQRLEPALDQIADALVDRPSAATSARLLERFARLVRSARASAGCRPARAAF